MLLLEGVSKSALAYDRGEYSEFCATLGKLAATLATSRDPSGVLAVAEAANDAIEDYNRGAQNVHAAQTVELRCMIEMLSQTLMSLADSGGQSVAALQSIRNQVESARQLDDIRLLRARLGDSLKSISDEARRQKERNAEVLKRAEEAAQAAAGQRDDREVDRVSGLPSTEKAESAITERAGADSRYYAAVFVVERVESVNLRYGYAAGDQLLQTFGRYLVTQLAPMDEVFRWRGPTFVALLDRSCSAEAVGAELARFASSRQEHVTQVDGRPLKLPLSCAWAVVPLAKCQIAGEASQQIDRFVTEHWDKRGA
jgi:GGDEF domain-containing protein